MTDLEILRTARTLIEKGWCQGVSAKNADGEVTGEYDPDAVSFCVLGAIWRADPTRASSCDIDIKLSALLSEDTSFNGFLSDWNDHPKRTKGDVLALFDRAIARHTPAPRPVDNDAREDYVAAFEMSEALR